MKSILRWVVSLSLTVVIVATAVAQITITAADVGAALALGTSITSRTDTATHTANIGTLGATSWNFSALVSSFSGTVTSVRPDTTPFFSFFPGSTHAQRFGLGAGAFYSYQKLGANLLFPGSAQAGSFTFRSRNIPDAILYQLPMTLGTNWTSAYAESSIVAFLPPPAPPTVTINNHAVTNTVDAHGNVTLPGGGVYAALRLKTDRRVISTSSSSRIISYSFLARNGASVTVVPADTLQPNTGTINVSSISWSGGTSDVRLSDALPANFTLMQNYPNPFNPSTRITYQVAREEFVSLKVYDILGKEIATLISEEKSPGTYAVDWSANGIPSGVYFYLMQTGSFRATKQMLVLK